MTRLSQVRTLNAALRISPDAAAHRSDRRGGRPSRRLPGCTRRAWGPPSEAFTAVDVSDRKNEEAEADGQQNHVDHGLLRAMCQAGVRGSLRLQPTGRADHFDLNQR